MTFDIHFMRGPLDGLTLDGDTSNAGPDDKFANECFRRSRAGAVGTIFETFDPHLLATRSSEPTRARLHLYGVESATSFNVSIGWAIIEVHVEVKVVYRRSSDRYEVLKVDCHE